MSHACERAWFAGAQTRGTLSVRTPVQCQRNASACVDCMGRLTSRGRVQHGVVHWLRETEREQNLCAWLSSASSATHSFQRCAPSPERPPCDTADVSSVRVSSPSLFLPSPLQRASVRIMRLRRATARQNALKLGWQVRGIVAAVGGARLRHDGRSPSQQAHMKRRRRAATRPQALKLRERRRGL
jgi:hypothetical protein